MLIAFEGPDRAGKTTLAKAFAEFAIIPMWWRPVQIEAFKDCHKAWDLFVLDELSLLDVMDFHKMDLVIDRHPLISEAVYSMLAGRKSRVVPHVTPKALMARIQGPILIVRLKPKAVTLTARGLTMKKAQAQLTAYNFIFQAIASKIGGVKGRILELEPLYTDLPLGSTVAKVQVTMKDFKEELKGWSKPLFSVEA